MAKGKFVALALYPLDFNFVCSIEIIVFSDCTGKFRNIDFEVIAWSTDSQYGLDQ